MDHAKVQAELQAYLDAALPPDRMRAVRAHLERCGACRAELALLREVDETLRAWPALPEPEGLAARVMEEVRSLPPRTARASFWAARRPWLREHWSEMLLGAALAATIVVLAVSGRALSAREAVDLRFWELQVGRAAAAVERVWYALRADAGGGLNRYVVRFYLWAAGAVALLAGALSAGVVAQQWRRGMS